MIEVAAILLFLVSTQPNFAIGGRPVSPTEQVECYSTTTTNSQGPCSGTAIGTMAALDCCSGNGSTFTYTNQCLGCLILGFTVAELSVTPDNASDTVTVDLVVEKLVGSFFSIPITVNSVDFSRAAASEINEFVLGYPSDEGFTISSINTPTIRKQSYNILISSTGNSQALEDPLTFVIQASSLPFFAGDLGLIFSQPTVNVTVADLDVIVFSFELNRRISFTEGDEGPVIVERNSVRPSRPVIISVTSRRLFDITQLGPNEYLADETDFVSQTRNYVFVENGETRLQESFTATEDSIVESGQEVFEVYMTSNETLVVIPPDRSVQRLYISDDDEFQIGFSRTIIDVTEGVQVLVTIEQINDVIGERRPDNLMERPNVNNVNIPNDAQVGEDYNFTSANVPNMMINETTERLTPISFLIGSTFHDNILEGQEKFGLRVLPSNSLQVGQNSFVTIHILDATAAVIRLKEPVYYVNESTPLLSVCAEIVGPVVDLRTRLSVLATLRDVTATESQDYFRQDLTFRFMGTSAESCIMLLIFDDPLREPLKENFTIALSPLESSLSSQFTNLTVDETPSYVVILDNDRAEVYFEQRFASFSENDGDQDIYLRMTGGFVLTNTVVVVYNLDNGQEVGRVTFVPSSNNQRESFPLRITDNSVALEPNQTLRLGIRQPQLLGIGTPSEMTVVIVDDDVVNVTFVSSYYHYNENHGVVSNIQVQLSSPIAQPLSVLYSGGPSTPQTGVVISGVTVSSNINFQSNSSALTTINIDSFNLTDDETALELNEQYQIMFTSSSITTGVYLGPATTIAISDDDDVTVEFESGSHSFSEGNVQSSDISLMLSTSIAQPLTVRVVGGPGDQPSSVVASGSLVNSTVTFPVGQVPLMLPSFIINDDSFGLELNEEFELEIVSSSPSDNVILGEPANITITDDDNVTVRFNNPYYTFAEDDGQSSDIVLILSNPVAQDLSVTVFGEPGQQPSTVEVSGFTLNANVLFAAFSNTSQPLPTFPITNDEVALETLETFTITLVSANPSEDVFLGSDSAIMINDDDVATVMFINETYSFNEGESGQIGVRITTAVAQDVRVSVNGGPNTQLYVNLNGPTINETILFTARGNMAMSFPIQIGDDDVALENMESYMITLSVIHPTNQNLQLGSAATIEITSEDDVSVDFEHGSYTFSERDLQSFGISLMLSTTIAQPLTVVVGGEPTMQPSSIVVSRTPINLIVTFPAGQAPLMLPSFSIIDDNFGLELDEEFELELVSSSPSDNVILGEPANITITDDDTVTVRFGELFYGFAENDSHSSGIELVLSNPIAQDLSVTVFGEPGQQPSTVEVSGFTVSENVLFVAFTGLTRLLSNYTITNDEVALETIETFNITLMSANPSKNVAFGSDSTIAIADDDVVMVVFTNETYSFPEYEDGQIGVRLTTAVAQDVRITVNGGPGTQPHVFSSGPNINQEVLFPARGNRVATFPIDIENDEVALENLESYVISSVILSPINPNLVVGNTATIEITSEDVVTVTFSSPTNEFQENINTDSIGVQIDNPIARDLVVFVFGESQPSPGVQVSGELVNTSVTFNPQSIMLSSFFITITDDSVALERDEEFSISFTTSSYTEGVMFGSSTQVTITDDDMVTADFSEAVYSFSEGAGQSSGIAVVLSNRIAQDLSISIHADPGQQPNTVEVSGFTASATITFLPFSNTSLMLPAFIINDDNVALETVESYAITLVSSNPNITDVNLGPAATIEITDDETLIIGFAQDHYMFTEGDLTAGILLTINHVIYQDISVTLAGESPSQFGVVISGPSINLTRTFTARGNSSILQSLPIMDDFFGRENNEQYDIQLIGSSPSADITTRGTTTITISDDDATSVSFSHSSYTFTEDAGLTRQVNVEINRPVAQGFTVLVSGSTTPLAPGVVDSGSDVNDSITFEALNPLQSNLQQIVEIQIKNDNVSGEPIQQYTLALSGQPNDVSLSPLSTTTINIDDDDVSGVRFGSFVGPLFESSQMYNLTVFLNGEVSSPASVDVLDANGITVGTVVFQPMQGQTTQQKTVTITFANDDIALEDDEILSFSLSNPVGTNLTAPSTVDVVITDDDVVTVTFVSSTYNYTEDHGEVSNIQAQLSNPIANNLTVLITGNLQGTPYSSNLMFQAGTLASSPIAISPFNINNDETGLEADELHLLMFSDSSISTNVILGQPTTIRIIDEDVVTVSFANDRYNFFESDGLQRVQIEVNRPVARDFSVRVFGVTTPLAPGVVDSGSNVNELLTFGPQRPQTQRVSLNITDDDVSGEPDQEYSLTLSQAPQDVALSPHDNTTIIIIDDDQSRIRFLPFMGPLFESAKEYNLTVVLDGAISSPASVTVRNASGHPIQVVTFQPMQGQLTQQATIKVTFDDDDIALEDNEIIGFSLSDPQGSILSPMSTTIDVVVMDDDVVTVMFTNETYRFGEGDSGQIGVKLSTEITKNVTVLILGVSDTQPYVANSGPVINHQITFIPGGSRVIYLPIQIGNDSFALESIEAYNVSLTNIFSVQNVAVGSPSSIEVIDNDVLNVNFVDSEYTFGEADGRGTIIVQIDKPIVCDLLVSISGESMPTPGVVVSGAPVNSVVNFTARGPMMVQFSVQIINDSFGLENDEEFEVQLTSSTPAAAVILGPRTRVIINDDDMVSILFDQDSYIFNENDGTVSVTLSLNREISSNFYVNIVGGPADSPFITESGPQINRTVHFTAGGNLTYSLPLTLRDDENALEDIESFVLRLESPQPANVDTSSTTTVNIVDDDVVSVNFSILINNYDEDEPTPQIDIQIDRTILRDLEVSVFGESLPVNGVVISGNLVNETIRFLAQDAMMVSLPISITNDNAALENIEIFSIRFEDSNPSDKVNLGSDTTVRITDDDDVNVNFVDSEYTFGEADGRGTIAVQIDKPIVRDLLVSISGESMPTPGVVVSGAPVNSVVNFTARGPMMVQFSVQIINDSFGLENDEEFEVQLTSSTPAAAVILGPRTRVIINDDDMVSILFDQDSYIFNENDGTVSVTLSLNREISSNFYVNVVGGPADSPFITESGPQINRTVHFTAGGNLTYSLPLTLRDDENALEDIESFVLRLESPQPANVDTSSTTTVNIVDDDVVSVNFSSLVNSFYENELSPQIGVQIDRTILRDLEVSVFGESIPVDGVVISGNLVNETVRFLAQDALMVFFLIGINDDNIAVENVESFSVKFEGSSPSDKVSLGPDTTVTILDNDVLSYGALGEPNLLHPENGGERVISIAFSPFARSLTFALTSVFDGPTMLVPSLESIECDGLVNGTLQLSPSLTTVVVNCTIRVTDDMVAHEDDEIYRLGISLVSPDPNSILVSPGTTMVNFTIEDNDISSVIIDVPVRQVTEGNSVSVCVLLRQVSLRGVNAVLNASGISATVSIDFVDIGEQTVVFPAESTGRRCINITTTLDSILEGDEEFDVRIIRVGLSSSPQAQNPQLPLIDTPFSETITINDIPPDSRTCQYSSSSGNISTFGDTVTYPYSETCERALLFQMTPAGEFGVFIESLDGSFMTTRIGVRFSLNESIVVNAFNRTIIRQSPALNLISFTSTATKLTIAVLSLGLTVDITASGVSVTLVSDSALQSHRGLCGNLNGDLAFRNGTVIDPSNMVSLNKMIRQFLTPPSETFIRMVPRRECGLLGEDLETGDPLFVVPLYTPSAAKPHSYSLCYEIHGYKDQTYNLISDDCTQVSGHYYEAPDPDPDSNRPFHAVNHMYITAVNNNHQCVNISVHLNNGTCSASVGDSSLVGGYIRYGISVRQSGNRVRVSVPNCADNRLVMYVICQNMHTSIPYLELKVIRGLNLREASHGVIGQFWNVETNVTKYTKEMRDGSVADNTYLVELMPKNKPKRSFVGFLYDRTWNFEEFPCIYAGNSQGGPIYEVADGEPNDSLIEGTIEDYSITNFVYDHFDDSRC